MMRSSASPTIVVGAAALVAGLASLAGAVENRPAPAAAKVDFSRDIRPVISAKCFACHGPDDKARVAGLRLDLRAEAVKSRAIVPGKAAESRVYVRISARDPAQRMPPPKSGHNLTPEEIQLIRRWIDQGAPYAQHWAFVPPKLPSIPRTRTSGWVRSPIDAFILARLEKEGLKPSPEADRYTLIRRVSLDLTGLPPTPAEVDQFIADRSPDAYEKLVDRLLASPHYGERWARMWLDLARYADSAGYGSDPLRLNIWPYRDWVIDAFNHNLSYDQFTIEQIAGDLLPQKVSTEPRPSGAVNVRTGQAVSAPTSPDPGDPLIATAFHRNTMTNTEGGTDDEEFRVAAVKDRIATTTEVWMGLTLGCAQCHSHKYDPITQREYYQFFALFNQTEDADRPDEAPTAPVLPAAQREQHRRLNEEYSRIADRLMEVTPEFKNEVAAWERAQSRPVPWVPLDPVELRSASGTLLTRLPDGSILASGSAPAADTYTVRARTSLKGITALRLELLPDASLPKGGPGRSADGGNVVLTGLRVTAAPATPRPVRARFVRIENTGPKRLLSLAEVQVFSAGSNAAVRGRASQSSTDFDGPARLAIDGNTNGDFAAAQSTTHTSLEDNPWWEVDLGTEVPVDEVAVWNRTDNDLGKRLSEFRVTALDAARKPVWENRVAEPPNPSIRLSTAGEQAVSLANPSASFNQSGFAVAGAIDTDAKTGWAIGGETGQPNAAVFETVTPALDADGGLLTFTLSQAYGGGHTLGRFRLLATTASRPVRELPKSVRAILNVPEAQRPPEQRSQLADYFRPLAPSLAPIYRELAQKEKEIAAVKPVDLPITRELPAEKRRTTHILIKGNFLVPGEKVEPGLPASFPPLPPGAPLNRLGVARWLVSPDNPLTARVAVNRFWAQLFGTGIVETEEDFGTQGSLPTHPELLDWLAVRFAQGIQVSRSSGIGDTRARSPEYLNTRIPEYLAGKPWDTKALLRLIVTSATYRQSSRLAPGMLEKDPRNRLLGRFPRRRLDAEGVRDQALTLSGLLSRKIGGPSVYPPQPDGLWRAAFNGQRTWPTSTGEDRYRRGIYTFWRRTVPYPSMSTFDAPSREICTVRRLPTNTPLQALVTLNDPAYVEMAQALGRRIAREGGAAPADRVRYGLRLVLSRPPGEEQVQALLALYEKELAHYRSEAESAKKLATDPLGPLPEGLDTAEAAAWTVVANVLLNLDGVLTKG